MEAGGGPGRPCERRCTTSPTTPLDVIKTRYQALQEQPGRDGGAADTAYKEVTNLFRKEGLGTGASSRGDLGLTLGYQHPAHEFLKRNCVVTEEYVD